MKSDFFEGLRSAINASAKSEEAIKKNAELMLIGMESQRKEFERKKKEIEDDIRRGSHLSSGRIPV